MTLPKSFSTKASLRIYDEMGQLKTLGQGADAFMCVHKGPKSDSPVLLLGLGPDPTVLSAQLSADGHSPSLVAWVENPEFCKAINNLLPQRQGAIPPSWREVDNDAAVGMAAQCHIWLYTQNTKLFPSFWGPLLGRIHARILGLHEPQSSVRGLYKPQGRVLGLQGAQAHKTRSVILPGSAADLLHQELAEAFAHAGLEVCPLSTVRRGAKDGQAAERAALVRALRNSTPALFFSVNGRGLDAEGQDFALLHACNVPVCLWFVDNPWHILSAWRLPWWQEAHIFVTDASFITGLRQLGARHVHHLPLAYGPNMLVPKDSLLGVSPAEPVERILFVGRARFPAREKFFAAARVDADVLACAMDMLCGDTRPDFHWWTEQMAKSRPEQSVNTRVEQGTKTRPEQSAETGAEQNAKTAGLYAFHTAMSATGRSHALWPGHGVRQVGLGAELCATAWRVAWLKAAQLCGLTVYGDTVEWQKYMPEVPPETFRPAVDYYTVLPHLYAAAPYTLNVTSLLLPSGLTQRHFDVWAAGGFLLTDSTAGLDIFPADLVREIKVNKPNDLALAVQNFDNAPQLRQQVRAAWQKHILENHSYAHRVAQVLKCIQFE